MINMGHCRFENTNEALIECIDAIESRIKTSESEVSCAKALYENAKEYIEVYEMYGVKVEND
jgi:hypothetical protein